MNARSQTCCWFWIGLLKLGKVCSLRHDSTAAKEIAPFVRFQVSREAKGENAIAKSGLEALALLREREGRPQDKIVCGWKSKEAIRRSPLAYQQEKSVCLQGFYGILFRCETRLLLVSG